MAASTASSDGGITYYATAYHLGACSENLDNSLSMKFQVIGFNGAQVYLTDSHYSALSLAYR